METNNVTRPENAAPICQCCGMPMNDAELFSVEPDGSVNTEYCKWCYVDGQYTYTAKEPLLDFMLSHMPNPDGMPDEARRAMYDGYLSTLRYWQ